MTENLAREELAKEGMAQLEALGFCHKCGRPIIRQWINEIQEWTKLCAWCLIEIIKSGRWAHE